MAFLAFPGAFANECSTGARRIVATHAMHCAHARDAHAYVVVAFDALPIDWLAKPLDFVQVATVARRALEQHRVDVVTDFFRDFFPPRRLSILLRMASTATNRTSSEMRRFFSVRRFCRRCCSLVGRCLVVCQATPARHDERGAQEPFPGAACGIHNAPSWQRRHGSSMVFRLLLRNPGACGLPPMPPTLWQPMHNASPAPLWQLAQTSGSRHAAGP